MRYLGNKETIATTIKDVILECTGMTRDSVFFDAFCGAGSIANQFKDLCNIVINDNLSCASIYTYGRLISSRCKFKLLGFNPIGFFNESQKRKTGFFFNTYSPGGSDRMYLTPENASRIDYFRDTIESWNKKKILLPDEYQFLLACLIETLSSVSNTAGVYGAFLKKWDQRALKKIRFLDITDGVDCCFNVSRHTDKLEDIIQNIDCDVIYLDPPYTQNQYGTQYHLLETLVLNDNPTEISKVTGSRKTTPFRSNWSVKYKVHILFDKVLAETKAQHVFLSYSNAGDMSKEYIESIMKRYGYIDSFRCVKIPYKKYENWKSQNNNEHFEYLFYIKKKPSNQVLYESPLNYIGSKAKVVPSIKNAVKRTKCFVDAFGGGFNVGINIDADVIYYNDINFMVTALIRSFRDFDTYNYILFVKRFIQQNGLEKGNKHTYLKARDYFNKLPQNKKDIRILFALILYSYQQQIRFNSNYDFNNPVGIRWFNDSILAKLVSFAREIKRKNVVFSSCDYTELSKSIQFSRDTLIYYDPPFKLTTGSYNDGKRGFKGWDNYLEAELFQCIDSFTDMGIPCLLSYVLTHKGKVNHAFKEWIDEHAYKYTQLDDIIGISGKPRSEVLVQNYD